MVRILPGRQWPGLAELPPCHQLESAAAVDVDVGLVNVVIEGPFVVGAEGAPNNVNEDLTEVVDADLSATEDEDPPTVIKAFPKDIVARDTSDMLDTNLPDDPVGAG